MRQRRRLVVRGVVQGVGLRPFASGLARRLGLDGSVRNQTGSVVIEIEGRDEDLRAFIETLVTAPPPLASIADIDVADQATRGERGFVIAPSAHDLGRATSLPADVATCDACLEELRDPGDRRHRYPFLSCTQCGPRFTIIRQAPFDRAATSMEPFVPCPDCRREYDTPTDRRHHAEAIACPSCGPSLAWETVAVVDRDDTPPDGAPLDVARAWLAAGRIVAVKGIGGFHLACDATCEPAVSRLRSRKARAHKPFAIMVPTLDAARGLCRVSDVEARQLESPARPIVLLGRREADGAALAPSVAPGQAMLGVVLPYSPLHHLLADRALVMTSGNLADEPIARTDDEARNRLSGIADAFLVHDREIQSACDDSVIRVVGDTPVLLRRSRGYVPLPVGLPVAVQPVLAVGADLKATVCLAEGRDGYLSQHLGDMGSVASLDALERAVAHMQRLFNIAPGLVAVDAHPAYESSRWARRWAEARHLPVAAVQHHRAHLAALMAEHAIGPDEPVVGVVFDGTGYGDDGTVWGGEGFVGTYVALRRVASLAPAPLPAAEADIRAGARQALAHLAAAGIAWDGDLPCVQACSPAERRVLAARLDRGLGTVASSSMGRLFDAVASLLGIAHVSSYEAQAAMALEAAACPGPSPHHLPAFATRQDDGMLRLDPAPVLRALVEGLRDGVDTGRLAAAFHDAVSDAVVAIAVHASSGLTTPTVGLSGGVFQNAWLLSHATARLQRRGFRVLTHRLVPPNDGGLSLGQAVVAALSDPRGPCASTGRAR